MRKITSFVNGNLKVIHIRSCGRRFTIHGFKSGTLYGRIT